MAAKEEVEAINKHMAEKVMGWEVYEDQQIGMPGIDAVWINSAHEITYSIEDFNPSTDLNHAEKALVQWLEDNKGWVVIDSHRKYLEIGCHAMWEIDISAKVDLPSIESLSAAITEALCKATGGAV